MPKIRINASEAGVRKNLSSACEEFLRHCRLRNLSPHTLEYYRENLYYIQRILKLNYADELTKDKVDELIDHELDKGSKELFLLLCWVHQFHPLAEAQEPTIKLVTNLNLGLHGIMAVIRLAILGIACAETLNHRIQERRNESQFDSCLASLIH